MTPVNHLIMAIWASAIFCSICASRRLEAKLETHVDRFGSQIFGGPIAQSAGQAMSLVARETRLLEIFG